MTYIEVISLLLSGIITGILGNKMIFAGYEIIFRKRNSNNGHVSVQSEDFYSKLDLYLSPIESRLTSIDSRLSAIDNRLNGIDSRVSRIENQIINIFEQFTIVDSRIGRIGKL